jgi:hypothetical protein
MDLTTRSQSRRALIVIPGVVNPIYNLSSRRIAEALGERGFEVDVGTLGDPLGYLVMEPALVGKRLSSRMFPRLRRRYRADWRAFPTLTAEIARALNEAGIETGDFKCRAA